MLTGSELLARVKELDGASKSELVRDCGYVSTKKNGSERLNFTAFYEALLAAKGMSLGDGVAQAHAGRKLSYTTTTHFNGNLLIGKAYTAAAGIKPGDAFEIRFGRNGRIVLAPINADGTGVEDTGAEDTGASIEDGEGEAVAPAPRPARDFSTAPAPALAVA